MFLFHIAAVDRHARLVFTHEGPTLRITTFYDDNGDETADGDAALACIAEHDGLYFPIENLRACRERVLH